MRNLFQDRMSLGQVFVAGALALDEIRHRVEAEPIDAEVEPETHDTDDFVQHPRIVKIQIGLMRVEAVPVIGLRHWIPGPV